MIELNGVLNTYSDFYFKNSHFRRMKKMAEKLCSVIKEDISLEDISKITKQQSNTTSPNDRIGDEDAFTKALNGSKIFLKAQGYIEKESEE